MFCFYVVFRAFIRSRILLCDPEHFILYDSSILLDNLKHFYAIFVHSNMILNSSMRFRAKPKQNIPVIPILTIFFG